MRRGDKGNTEQQGQSAEAAAGAIKQACLHACLQAGRQARGGSPSVGRLPVAPPAAEEAGLLGRGVVAATIMRACRGGAGGFDRLATKAAHLPACLSIWHEQQLLLHQHAQAPPAPAPPPPKQHPPVLPHSGCPASRAAAASDARARRS